VLRRWSAVTAVLLWCGPGLFAAATTTSQAGDAEGGPDERLEGLIAKAERAARESDNAPPLLVALARMHDSEVLDYYLERSAEKGEDVQLDEADEDGCTALWHAVMDGRRAATEILVKRGASLDVQKTKSGLSPLMSAAMNGDEETCSLLIEAGANLETATGKNGATALVLALQSNHADLAEFLIQKGAKIDLTQRAWKFLCMLLMRSETEKDQESLNVILANIQGDEVNLDRWRRFGDSVHEMKVEEREGGSSLSLEDWDEDFEDQDETKTEDVPSRDEL
jgi:hypothetical protein